MPSISRQDSRLILEYLEAKTDIMSKRQLDKAIAFRSGLLHGGANTKRKKKYGRVITIKERKGFFEELAKEMRLTNRQTNSLMWEVNDRNLPRTLLRAKDYANPKKDNNKNAKKGTRNDGGSGGEQGPRKRGFWKNVLGLP